MGRTGSKSRTMKATTSLVGLSTLVHAALALALPAQQDWTFDKSDIFGSLANPNPNVHMVGRNIVTDVDVPNKDYLCKVSNVVVEVDVQAAGGNSSNIKNFQYPSSASLDEIYVPKDLKSTWVSNQYFSDIDGRSRELFLGTPGGDFGEFVLGLQAYEQTLPAGYKLSLENVKNALEELAREMSPSRKFYFMTDFKHLTKLETAVKCNNIKIVNPPDKFKDKLLEEVAKPENVGCFHIKNMLRSPDKYNIRKGLVADALKALHLNLWNKTSTISRKLKYTVLRGELDVRGFINIRPPAHCLYAGLATFAVPCATNMVPGNLTQLLINHPEPVVELRTFIANFLAKYGPEWHPMITKFGAPPPVPLRKEDFDPTELGRTVLRIMLEQAPNSLASTVTPLLRGAPAFTISQA